MIVIRLRSGLGNQMFQYAFFLQMQKWYGKESVKLDIDTYHWKVHNGREVDKIFQIDLKKDSVDKSVSLQMADVGYSIKNRVLRRLRSKKHHCYKFWKELEFEDYKNLSGDIYLEGYWNEERFFEEVKNQVRHTYRFPEITDNLNKTLLLQVQETCSVGIHVRRGDYIKYTELLPMCPVEYYQKAVEIIQEKLKSELYFYVFSDEIDWCRKNLNFSKNIVFVENNTEKNSYRDMNLMSACKCQIMANSTFSWWAAWLNNNPEKTVIYPSSMSKTCASMPEEWICINMST